MEDKDLTWRFLLAGHRMRYVPGAVMMHRHYNTIGEVSRQLKGYGYGLASIYARYPHLDLGRRRFNLMGYLTLCAKFIRLFKIPFIGDEKERTRLKLDFIRASSLLIGKMAGSIENRRLFL